MFSKKSGIHIPSFLPAFSPPRFASFFNGIKNPGTPPVVKDAFFRKSTRHGKQSVQCPPRAAKPSGPAQKATRLQVPFAPPPPLPLPPFKDPLTWGGTRAGGLSLRRPAKPSVAPKKGVVSPPGLPLILAVSRDLPTVSVCPARNPLRGSRAG
jgi:hypothetical protein